MSTKLHNDKYYTPIDLANHCWDTALNLLGEENITQIIEPSVGDGSFYHYKRTPDIGYDIAPECDFEGVTKGDWLTAPLAYRIGRLIIGNPPYGTKLKLGIDFFKKSASIADYIAFILPISQFNNTHSLYEFDLLHSEDLGLRTYTDRELHCCFNIYARPKNGIPNKKTPSRLKDVTICRQDNKNYDTAAYDIRMCYWGNGSAGRILSEGEHYAGEYKIKINNPQYREEIIELLSNYNWEAELGHIAMRKIQQHHIISLIKKNFPDVR